MALLHLEDGQDDLVGWNRLTQQLYYRRDANQSEDRSICVEDGRRILRWNGMLEKRFDDANQSRAFAQVVGFDIVPQLLVMLRR